MWRHSIILGVAAVTWSLEATAFAQQPIFTGPTKPGLAILSPVECPDIPRTGIIGVLCSCHHKKGVYTPYYSPLVPISNRWRGRDCHGNTMYTHYYPDLLPRCQRGPNLFVADSGDPWFGPSWGYPDGEPTACGSAGSGVGGYGSYTGAPQDEASLKKLGGLGLDSNGFQQRGAADIIDRIGCGR